MRTSLLWLVMGSMWMMFAIGDAHKGYAEGAEMDFAAASVFLLISAVCFTLRRRIR